MAACSYQTLIRYDEDTLRKHRARNLDDIRFRERTQIANARHLSKAIKMLQNRRSLIESIIDQDADTESICDYLDNTLTEDHYFNTPSKSDDDFQCDWLGPPETCSSSQSSSSLDFTKSDWVSPASSPAWSTSTSSYSAHLCTSPTVTVEGYEVPAYLLETPQTPLSGYTLTGKNKSSSSTLHQFVYKKSTPWAKSKQSPDYDAIMADFNLLEESIHQNYGDAPAVSNVIQAKWQTVNSILRCNDSSLITKAIDMLASAAADNLLSPETILHVLQHGLISSLKYCHERINDGAYQIVKLLLSLSRLAPAAIPYMVDLMKNSQLLRTFEQFIEEGSRDDVKYIAEFYYQTSEVLINQVLEETQSQVQQQLILPNILLVTGVERKTLQSFNPMTTLEKLMTPSLIMNMVKICLSRSNQREEELMTMTLVVLANALKLAHVKSTVTSSSDTRWTIQIMEAFNDSKLEQKLNILVQALTRLQVISESSNQSSQGFGTGGSASRSREQCEHFLIFYQQYYQNLSTWLKSSI